MWEKFKLRPEKVLNMTTRRIDWMIKGLNKYQSTGEKKEESTRTHNPKDVMKAVCKR